MKNNRKINTTPANKRPSAENNGKLTKFALHIVSLVISAASIFYLGYHFLSSFSTDIETEYAVLVTDSDMISLDGYIFRNERVLYTEQNGDYAVGVLQSDGTKVKVGGTVANLYNASATTNTDSIVAIDKQLDLLTSSSLTDGMTSSDTSVIDSRIATYYYTIRKASESGSYQNLQKRRDEMLTLINKRMLITGAVDSYDAVIEDLKFEREQLTLDYENASGTVTTPVSGYFYSQLDGYERIFTADSLAELTLDGFDSLLDREPTSYAKSAVGKVATDFDWYVVSETNRESLRYFNEGSTYTVQFPYNNDESIRMTLSDIIQDTGSERILLVFETNKIPEDFSFRRMQPIEVVRSSHTGYRVPISAVRLVDGVQGVYILVGSTVEFREIEILLELDGYYIVAPQDTRNDPDYAKKLGVHDAIITGGKGLYVGKTIE
ncbi:MAG: hypothetical protein HFE63_03300 [Clostridiales bacterium]|nr:hypothetical protein [Clostridiales bacterium]